MNIITDMSDYSKDKEYKQILSIPPNIYSLAIRLSGDVRYWKSNKALKFWGPMLSPSNLANILNKDVNYFDRPSVIIKLMKEAGLLKNPEDAK